VKALIFKYLFYWPWFVISAIVLVILAWVYLRYQAPVYNVTAAVLIQEDNNRGGQSGTLSAMQDLGMVSMTSKFDNELEVLHSRTLLREVITDLNLYASLYEKRHFGYDLPLYKNAPVQLYMTPDEASALEAPVRLDIDYTPAKARVDITYYVNRERRP